MIIVIVSVWGKSLHSRRERFSASTQMKNLEELKLLKLFNYWT